MTIPIDAARIEALFRFIVTGLLWHHWGVLLTAEHQVQAGALSREGEEAFRHLAGLRRRAEVHGDLGDGAFVYHGYQGTDYPELSVWEFVMIGGVEMTGDPKAPGESPSTIWGWSAYMNIAGSPPSMLVAPRRRMAC